MLILNRKIRIFLTTLVGCGIALSTCSCSPQRQLATLLANHPELRTDTTIVRQQTTILPAEQFTIHITAEQLASMQTAAASQTEELENDEIRTSVMVAHAAAALEADGLGGVRLTAAQLPDTIVKIDSVLVPKFYTTTRTQTVIKHQMNTAQRIFFFCGLFWTLIVALLIAIRIFSQFYKK